MGRHRGNTCTCAQKREPSYVRGFYKLMGLLVVVTGAAYFTVPYWPI
jgi:hypothetical protein